VSAWGCASTVASLRAIGADDSRGYARRVSGTARIVVVEDDASVAELVTLYLRNAGYIVEHAPTGERARAEAAQRIAGLAAAMDDSRAKPFNPKELVSRVRAILRRASGMPGGGRVLRVGNLSVDTARHEVLVGERAVVLRAKEFELLEAFCRQPGMVLTRDKLLEDVWGFAYPGETRTVDVHVNQLRDKLAGTDAKIETVWGVGYKMVAPST